MTADEFEPITVVKWDEQVIIVKLDDDFDLNEYEISQKKCNEIVEKAAKEL